MNENKEVSTPKKGMCKKKKVILISSIAAVLVIALGLTLFFVLRKTDGDDVIDSDGDGIPDHLDVEVPDNLDNDNVVNIDERYPELGK